MSKNPKVEIKKHIYGEGNYVEGNQSWNMSTIQNATKGLLAFDLQLAALDISVYPWDRESQTISNFIYHFERVKNVGFDYPVILDPDGYIIDGWHRIAKAVLEKMTEVKAVRLIVMPQSDKIINKE